MHLIANMINNRWLNEVVRSANPKNLEQIDLAVAYVSKMELLFDLAKSTEVPINLYTLADGWGNPHIDIMKRFLETSRTSWRLFLYRDFYHPKIIWLRGVGVYIGSANLSDRAWWKNIECGIWFTQNDMEKNGMVEQLQTLFKVIRDQSQEATTEVLSKMQELERNRARLKADENKHQDLVDKLLGDLPGKHSLIDFTERPVKGGIARRNFIEEWNQGLTILRKIAKIFDENKEKWPSWVSPNAHPAIVQDQATEWFWDTKFRRSGQSSKHMLKAHNDNLENPDKALSEFRRLWCALEGEKYETHWAFYVNDSPKKLHTLLQKDKLQRLDRDQLNKIISLCHASREHARQIRNADLGLDPGENRSIEERCELFTNYLLQKKSGGGKNIQEVLFFVLWGDEENTDAAERIWSATSEDKWRLPHLGVHILGELIGYARPDDFPPRNNRVSKTLYALGYENISYI